MNTSVKLVSFLALTVGLSAGCKEDSPSSASPLAVQCGERVYDPLNVLSHEVRGNLLDINIDYAGGCEEHVEASFQDPTNIRLRLMHDSNGDLCEALISETLTFDMGAFLDCDDAQSFDVEILPGGAVFNANDTALFSFTANCEDSNGSSNNAVPDVRSTTACDAALGE